MHALHLPPRHVWRVTALAALLAVLITAVLAVPASELVVDSGSSTTSVEASTPPSQPLVDTRPSWASDPLSPVTVR